jgi:predicted nucleotidyltransferase component of viral defense system
MLDRRQLEFLVKILHHLTRHFKEHAILKGGIELALFSSPRSTNDLDFVFVPFKSKKDIVTEVADCLKRFSKEITVDHQMTSKHAKFFVKQEALQAVVEINVAMSVESIAINTAILAKPFQLQPQVIRVMKPEIALSHKIAAWNERRLIRDLYDIYFWFSIQKILPDPKILADRLKAVESRSTGSSKKKSMSFRQLCDALRDFSSALKQKDVDSELVGLAPDERQGLDVVLKSQINILVAYLEKNIND